MLVGVVLRERRSTTADAQAPALESGVLVSETCQIPLGLHHGGGRCGRDFHALIYHQSDCWRRLFDWDMLGINDLWRPAESGKKQFGR